MNKHTVAGGMLSLAIATACLGGLAGCSLPLGQNDASSTEQTEAVLAANQAVVDKVNAIYQGDEAQFMEALGITVSCTGFADGVADVEYHGDLQRFLSVGTSLFNSSEDGQATLTDEEIAQAAKNAIEEYKAQMTADELKSSLSPFSQGIFTSVSEVNSIHWVVYLGDEAVSELTQGRDEVVAETSDGTTVNGVTVTVTDL